MAFTICCTLTFSFFIAPFIVRLCWHQCGITVLQSGKKNKTVAYCAVENVRGGSSGVNARAAAQCGLTGAHTAARPQLTPSLRCAAVLKDAQKSTENALSSHTVVTATKGNLL